MNSLIDPVLSGPLDLPPLVIGGRTLATPILLAPMCGFTDRPFRECVRSFDGLGLAYTEMISAMSLVRQFNWKVEILLATSAADQPLGIQFFGHEPDIMREGAAVLAAQRPLVIDINMGCSKHKVVRRGGGSALLADRPRAAAIVRAVVAGAAGIPVTVKLRFRPEPDWLDFGRAMVDAGAAALTLHGRMPGQGFSGHADLGRIRDLVAAVPVPVIGNGDIFTVAAAREMFTETGCAGVMIGRGIRKNPWLLCDINRDIQGLPPAPPPVAEDYRALYERHLAGTLELYGAKIGTAHFRKWTAQYVRKIKV
ncbi:MAG: tRNA-dihydrouridine synthase family protein [Planctomycetota bacterium]